MDSTLRTLDRLLDPLGRTLGPDAARQILSLRADVEAQGRMDYLAERANEGRLTADERAEYESLVSAAGMIAILQAKARGALGAV